MERGLITDLFTVRFEQCSSSRVLYQRVWNYIISICRDVNRFFVAPRRVKFPFKFALITCRMGNRPVLYIQWNCFNDLLSFIMAIRVYANKREREKYFSELSRWNELRVILISLTLKMLACCYTICTYNTYNVTRGDWLSLNWVITLSNCIWTGVSHCI